MANEALENERGGEDDVTRGHGALAARAAQIKAMPVPDKLRGVNLERAVYGGLETFDRVVALGLRARLEALPATIFDAACIDEVESLSLALLVTCRELGQQPTPTSNVSESLLEACNTLRAEMLTVIGYALADHEEAMVRRARIISGTGYKDKVSDLANLSDLYLEHADALAQKGGARYRPEDARRAVELSTELRKAVTGTVLPESVLARAWKLFVLLEAAHQELVDGVWILLRRENREPWASLHALSRRPARRKVAVPTTTGAAPEET